MAKGENIFHRKDGRWEARYIKGYELSGKIKYGFCYGKTYREAKEKVTKYWLQLLKKGYSASACCEPLADYRIVEGSRSHSKVQSAKNRWEVYRKVEKLSLLKSLSVFLSYTARGLRKYKRV